MQREQDINMINRTDAPKAFISHISSPVGHESWVLELAEKLIN